jgi:two-component sensor histidine kinase
VVSRSFDGKRNVTAAKVAVLNRLQSLSQTHDILVENEWDGACLSEIVRGETSPYAERVVIKGPPVRLNARAAQDFALAVHELATNAAKNGSLSNSAGLVQIDWSISDAEGPTKLNFRWQELDGPLVVKPRKKGFGSAVLAQVMSAHTDSPPVFDYSGSGLRYELNCPIDRVTASKLVAA